MRATCLLCEGPVIGPFFLCVSRVADGRADDTPTAFCERCFRFCGGEAHVDLRAVYLHITQPSVLDAIRFEELASFSWRFAVDQYSVVLGPGRTLAVVPRVGKHLDGAWTHVQPLTEAPAAAAGEQGRFVCDACDTSIRPDALRFRCADCLDFDLCAPCFHAHRTTTHAPEHAFYVVRSEMRLPCRGLLRDQTSVEVMSMARLRSEQPHLHAELEALDRACFGACAWPVEQVLAYGQRAGYHADAVVARRAGALAGQGLETALAAVVLYELNEDEGDAYIASLAVSPQWQGRGVGDLCLSQVLARANAVGLRTSTLHVDAANTPALGLYIKRGYCVAELCDSYYGPDRPGYLMQRPAPQ